MILHGKSRHCEALAMTTTKQKRKAERRKACSVTSVPPPSSSPACGGGRRRGHGAAPAGAARLSAFHHGTCGRDRTPPLSSSHATSQDLFGAHVPMVRKTERIATHDAKPANRPPCVTRGRYPRLKVPVQRDCTRSPVMMPSGRVLPKPPGSQGDEPRPAGTALAPPDGVTRPASWYGGEILCMYSIQRQGVKTSSPYQGLALDRHGRACPGHPRLSARPKTWMPGTRPGMTAHVSAQNRLMCVTAFPSARNARI